MNTGSVYCITILGEGPHHNTGNPGDADRLAAALVELLLMKGHEMICAMVTTPKCSDDISNGLVRANKLTGFKINVTTVEPENPVEVMKNDKTAQPQVYTYGADPAQEPKEAPVVLPTAAPEAGC